MPRPELLRDNKPGVSAHVTSVELFFDLVYVFAFTQLSEVLYEHLSLTGAADLAVLFVAVWWSWSYTAWATGWIDPEYRRVAALIVVLMLASLVMAASIVGAFGVHGETFALAYVTMQLLRNAFMVWAFGLRAQMGRTYLRVLVWSALSGTVWIVGGGLEGGYARLAVWTAAAALELAAPAFAFRLPGAAPAPVDSWKVAGGHLAERFQLLLTIAFGESFLRIGEAWAARGEGVTAAGAALAAGFVLVVALWSSYFLHHAAPGAKTLQRAGAEAARLARSAFMYAHGLMVAGVVVLAVAVHLTIERPLVASGLGIAAAAAGGAALFAVGLGLSKRWLGHGTARGSVLAAATFATTGAVTAVAGGSRLLELSVVSAVAVAFAGWIQAED